MKPPDAVIATSRMNHDQSPPVVLSNDQPNELADLRQKLVEAGVRNPLVALANETEVRDYFDAVCLAESLLPRLVPCLLLLDFKLPRLGQLVDWLRTQTVLEKLKIVILGDEESECAKRLERTASVEFIPKLPSLALLADLVAQACPKMA